MKITFLIALLIGSISGQTSIEKPIRVSLNELIGKSGIYDGKMVLVSAFVVSGFEEFGLSSNGSVAEIWLDYPSRPRLVPPPDFKLLSEKESKLLDKYLREKGCHLVSATFTGRFDYDDLSNSSSKFGYGDLNRFKQRLIIREIADVMTEKCPNP